MPRYNKITPEDPRFPAGTFNRLIEAEVARQLELATIDDQRKPKPISPVLVQLVWDDATAVDVGHTVKLTTPVYDPLTDGSAPFSGLKFHATAFSGGDSGSPSAITVEPIDGASGGISSVGWGIMAESYWVKIAVSDPSHNSADIPSSGTLLVSAQLGAIPITWKPNVAGEVWCVVPLGVETNIPLRDFPIVTIENKSGLPRPTGSIVGLGVITTTPPSVLTRFPIFESAAPDPNKMFAVLLADLTTNGYADAAIIGSVATQINLTDDTHEYCLPTAGDYEKMASAGSGPGRIQWREKQTILGAGTLGQQWAQLEIGLAVPLIESPRAEVYSIINGATGDRGQARTPGTGLVRKYLPPTGPAGTPWQPGSTLLVETWMRGNSDVGKPVLLRESRKDQNGAPIYELTAEGCQADPTSGG